MILIIPGSKGIISVLFARTPLKSAVKVKIIYVYQNINLRGNKASVNIFNRMKLNRKDVHYG